MLAYRPTFASKMTDVRIRHAATSFLQNYVRRRPHFYFFNPFSGCFLILFNLDTVVKETPDCSFNVFFVLFPFARVPDDAVVDMVQIVGGVRELSSLFSLV